MKRRTFSSSSADLLYNAILDQRPESIEDLPVKFSDTGVRKTLPPEDDTIRFFNAYIDFKQRIEEYIERNIDPLNLLFHKENYERPEKVICSYWNKRAWFLAALDVVQDAAHAEEEYIRAWIDDIHQPRVGDFSFDAHRIFKITEEGQIPIAAKFGKDIYYLWGGMKGHRFPKGDNIYPLKKDDWDYFLTLIELIKNMNVAATGWYSLLVADIGMIPKSLKIRNIYNENGDAGLLRHFFAHHWQAALVFDLADMSRSDVCECNKVARQFFVENNFSMKEVETNIFLCGLEEAAMTRLVLDYRSDIIDLKRKAIVEA